MVERLNRTILKDSRAYANGEDMAWNELLLRACFRYSATIHSATGITPFKATFGVESMESDAETGMRLQVGDRTLQDLAARVRQFHTKVL